jgi:hypothetical protein
MRAIHLVIAAAMLVMLAPSDSQAYIGPGAGLSAFGALLALVVSIIVAIFGFVWYPIKRLMRAMKRRRTDTRPDMTAEAASGSRP